MILDRPEGRPPPRLHRRASFWTGRCDPRSSGRTTATSSNRANPSAASSLRSSVGPKGDRHRPARRPQSPASRRCDPRSPRGETATARPVPAWRSPFRCDPRSSRRTTTTGEALDLCNGGPCGPRSSQKATATRPSHPAASAQPCYDPQPHRRVTAMRAVGHASVNVRSSFVPRGDRHAEPKPGQGSSQPCCDPRPSWRTTATLGQDQRARTIPQLRSSVVTKTTATPGLLSRRHVQAVPILDHPEEGRPPQHRSRPGRRSSCHLRFSGVSKATATPIVGPGGLSWASSCDPRPSGRTTATPSDLSLPSDSGLLRSSAFPRGDRHCEVPPSAARVHRFAILGRSAGRPQAASAGAAINKHQFPIPVAALLGRPEVRPPSRSGGRPSPCPCPCDSRPSKERRPPPDPDRGCVGP